MWGGRARHCRTRRRLHRAGRGRLHHRPDGEPNEHDAAHRSVPSGDLAFARLASRAENRADEMGDDKVSRPAVFLDRDGVLNRPVIRDEVPFPPATLEEFEIYPEVAD